MVLAAFACVVLTGQGKAKELPDLEVRSLTVKGTDGTKRAVLSMTEDEVALQLYDKTGTERIDLSTNGATALVFYDEAGFLRAKLGVGSLALHDAKGNLVWKAPPKK